MDCSPPGFSVHGISQARILEGVAISFSKYKAYLLLFDGQYLKVSLKKKKFGYLLSGFKTYSSNK